MFTLRLLREKQHHTKTTLNLLLPPEPVFHQILLRHIAFYQVQQQLRLAKKCKKYKKTASVTALAISLAKIFKVFPNHPSSKLDLSLSLLCFSILLN